MANEEQPTPTHHVATDWHLVDHLRGRTEELLAGARDDADLSAVGFQCGEVIVALARAVSAPQRHGSPIGLGGPAQAKHLLKAFIKERLGVEPYAMQHAEAALLLVDALHTRKTSDKRSAAMCVEATRSLVNVVAIAAGRAVSLHSITDLIRRFLKEKEGQVGDTVAYSLLRISKEAIGQKTAASLQAQDIINHCQLRRERGAAPATITQDIVYLRAVLNAAREEWNIDVSTDAIDQAKGLLDQLELTGRSNRRTRIPSSEELDQLLGYFLKQDKRSDIPMADIVEFALWTGRRIGEICSLRWDQVQADGTCQIRGHTFTLVGPAWTILQRQPRTDERVFPYNQESVSKRYIDAKIKFGIKDLRLNDLRREATRRLDQAGYTLDQIGKAIGRADLNSLRRDIESLRNQT